MTYRFFFEIINGQKKYDDVQADTFREARNIFFERYSHLTYYKLDKVVEISSKDYKVIYNA